MRRTLLSLFLLPLLLLGCSDSSVVDATDTALEPVSKNAPVFPEVIPLPDGFSPEGIVVGQGTEFYTGSLVDGAIYKGDLRTGAGEVLVPGQAGLLAVGLAFDARTGYLFVAGGFTGGVRVYDTGTGAMAGTFGTPGSGFINDVVVTKTAVFATDSFEPQMYRLPLGPLGALPPDGDLEDVPLGGDFDHVAVPGTFNSNGIVATPDGAHLVIVNGATGVLYLVDPMTGDAMEIDLGGDAVPSADGLVWRGKKLYVVQNFLNQVAEVALAPDLLSGNVVRILTSPFYRIPTTADIFGNGLYAVNARFDVAPPGGDNSAVEFEVVRVNL